MQSYNSAFWRPNYSSATKKCGQVHEIESLVIKAVPASNLGLTHPRRTKLQHGTFLHFGHPQLETTLCCPLNLQANQKNNKNEI